MDPKVSNFVREVVVHFQSIEIELWCGIISIGSTGCLIINSQNPFKNFIKPFDVLQYAWVEMFIHDLSITRHIKTIVYFLLRIKENGLPQQKDNHDDENQDDQNDDEDQDDDEDEKEEKDDKDKRKKKQKTKEETKEKRKKR